jgi:hypothetical protein
MSETIIQTPVSPEDFDKKCITPQVPLEDKTDCVIKSLFFLNFLDKTIATNRSAFANKMKGLSEEQIIREVYFSNKSKITKMICYNLSSNLKKEQLNFYLKDLNIGYGTIGLFQRESGIGHAVTVVRNTKDEITIMDLQAGVKYESLEEIDEFLTEYINICLLTPTLKRKRNILSPEEKIRKKGVESQKTKKIKLSKRKQTKSIHETRKTKSKRTRTKSKKEDDVKMDIDER